MPAFAFTADATSNTISITGHGLVTGDGPACVRNLGGALPSPLVAQTDYWVVRIDDNTLRLATSSGNALAGTFIDLSTTGSGTNTFEIGVPYRRPITYVDNVSQIRARDLNAFSDGFKALHAMFTGQPQSVWQTDVITPLVIGAPTFAHTRPEPAGFAPGANGLTGFTDIFAWVPLTRGMRVRAIDVRCKRDSAAGGANVALLRFDDSADGGFVVASLTIPSGGTGANETIPSGAIDYTIPDAACLAIVVQMAPSNGITLYRVVVKWDRPTAMV